MRMAKGATPLAFNQEILMLIRQTPTPQMTRPTRSKAHYLFYCSPPMCRSTSQMTCEPVEQRRTLFGGGRGGKGAGQGEHRSVQHEHGTWLDTSETPLTNEARITERFRRPSFGHLEIDITVDDFKAYTKPSSIHVNQTFGADTDRLEYVCLVAMILAGRADVNDAWRTAVWTAALVTMGTVCLVNALRCRRTHCYITGPSFWRWRGSVC